MTRLALAAFVTLLAPVLGTALVLVPPGTASAQSPEQLIEEGLDLRRQGRDQDALGRFEQAYRMGQSAQALAQIALAEQALGQFAAAETHLSTAIQVRNDPWIATRLGQLQQALASIQAQLGTLEIQGAPEGAEIYINGQVRGRMPDAQRLRVRSGTTVLEVRANGFVTVQRQVEVQAGGTWRENVAMVQAQAQVQVGGGAQYQAQAGYQGAQAQPVAGGGYVQPTQARSESHPNWKLFIAGTAVFAGLWVITGLGDLLAEGDGLGWIPLIGPWAMIVEYEIDFDYEQELGTLLVLDGIFQALGIVGAILGLVVQVEEPVYALGDQPDATTLALHPYVSPVGVALGDTGLGGVARSTGMGGAAGATLDLTHF